MPTPEEWNDIIGAVENFMRSSSGFRSFYADIDQGNQEIESEEDEFESTLNVHAFALEALLPQLDKKILVSIILALAGNFGDTATEDGEARLENFRQYLLTEE